MWEWDEAKSEVNLERHGVPLSLAPLLFDGPVVEWEDERGYEEERWIAVGEVGGRVLACVYTWRGERRRAISLRRATRSEAHEYCAGIG